MIDSKPWYLSKTIWASLIAVSAAIGSAFGFDIDATAQEQLTAAATQLIAVAASLLAVFGRLTATSRID